MAVPFHGGVHPPEHKEETHSEWIEALPLPRKVVVPMSMHTGAPCKPLVKVGDEVGTGQKIGEAEAFITAPIHSPITGKVTAIGDAPHPVLGVCTAVTIEGDGLADIPYYSVPDKSWDRMEPREIVHFIKEAGIVGLGGAAFPTHIKLSPPKDKKCDTLIINGAECEPYLTSDDRLMRERPQDVIQGILILKKASGASDVVLAIEDNKHLANKELERALVEMGVTGQIRKEVIKTQYPQGSEKQLIYALTEREVPSGGLPIDVGVIVHNVATAVAVFEALAMGKPLFERVVTISGDAVKDPGNYLVRIGTPFRALLEAAGGLALEDEDSDENEEAEDSGDGGAESTSVEIGKVIMGGPMMGVAQYTLDAPVIKGTSGILVLSKEAAKTPEAENCIRCGFCIKACPQKLMPQLLAKMAKKGMWAKMKDEYHLLDCMECGCCTYNCPSKIPIVQWIRLGKQKCRTLKI